MLHFQDRSFIFYDHIDEFYYLQELELLATHGNVQLVDGN